jgi:hypothetical protein
MSRSLHSALGAMTRDRDRNSSRHRGCVTRDRRIERNCTVYPYHIHIHIHLYSYLVRGSKAIMYLNIFKIYFSVSYFWPALANSTGRRRALSHRRWRLCRTFQLRYCPLPVYATYVDRYRPRTFPAAPPIRHPLDLRDRSVDVPRISADLIAAPTLLCPTHLVARSAPLQYRHRPNPRRSPCSPHPPSCSQLYTSAGKPLTELVRP